MSAAVASQLEITDEYKKTLLATAAEYLIAASLDRPPVLPDFAPDGPHSQPVAGTFVSLKRNGRLRSCCGSFGQSNSLDQSLRESAIRTATDDSRFPRISPSELPHLHLEVWLLDAAEQVPQRGDERVRAVTVGTHGLQVIRGDSRGLLLPGVAVENQWTAEEFLNQTFHKAGLPPTAWKDDETALWRFRGESCSSKLVDVRPVEETALNRTFFSSREFAQYAQYCRQTIDTIMTGGTPLYYCPSVSDANVKGAALIVTQTGADITFTLSKLSWRQTLPLQATLFAQCQEAAGILNRRGVRRGDFHVDLAIVDDVAMHGTVADPDLRGIDPASRGVIVLEQRGSGLIYDSSRSPAELLSEAAELMGVVEPARAEVLSFAVLSTCNRLSIASQTRPLAGPDIRPPAVAGRFYPGDAAEMQRLCGSLLEGAATRGRWAAAMVPHAGWRFSGKIAADVLKRIDFPKTVIAIGPKHTPHGVEWAVAPHQTWSLPGGEVESDRELATLLARQIPGLELDAAAHQQEHGIEVELPLIHALAPETRVVGIAIGGGSLGRCEQFAEGLVNVLAQLDERPLLLISSDMNHYANDAETRRLDELALSELDRLDPDGLFETVRRHHISMCGVLPAVIVLKALQRLDALHRCERVAYATSFDTTADPNRVVGYAGMLFN